MRVVLHESTRLACAADSLAGLSVGDALGAQYFMVGRSVDDLLRGTVPDPVWEWTDDTEMACSVFWMLQERRSEKAWHERARCGSRPGRKRRDPSALAGRP